jgi:hypothetical protein
MEPAQDHAEEGTKGKRGLREWLTRPKNKPKKTSKESPVYGIRSKAVAVTSTKHHGHEGGASSNQSASGGAEATTGAADLETTVTSLPQTTADKTGAKLALGSTSDHVSDPLPPVINSGQLPIRRPTGQAPESFQIVQFEPPHPSKNICGLWNEAYDDLKVKEGGLMKDYEEIIARDSMSIFGSASAVILGSGIMPRHEQMKAFLEKKLAQVKQDEWKLMFGAKKIPMKDLAAPVVGMIKWAQEYVDGAVSANPYASIAWAGISLLLPVSVRNSAVNPHLLQ